jgi:hypothetical protein
MDNIPIYTTPSLDSIFTAFIECHILLQYQRICEYINNMRDENEKNPNEKTFIALIRKVHNTKPLDFNCECEVRYNKQKIHYNILTTLMALNNVFNGNPDLSREPFVNLINNRLIQVENYEQIRTYALEAQNLMKSRYIIMLQEFQRDNNMDKINIRKRSKVLFRNLSQP